MIQTGTIVATIVSLLICLALFIVPPAWLSRRRLRILRPWLGGVIAFTISQILLRIPLIQLVLPRTDWYLHLSIDPIAHGLFLALTAGIFEEVARFLVFRHLLKDNRRWVDGVAFGFGHGGIEAAVIVGLTLVNLLVVFFAINNGTFDALVAGTDPAVIAAIRQQALTSTPLAMLLAGFERLLAVGLHIGMTMIVLVGLRIGKPWPYLAAAIGVHTLIDATAAILPRILPISPLVLELFLLVYTILLIRYALKARRHFPEAPPLAALLRDPHAGPDPVRKGGGQP